MSELEMLRETNKRLNRRCQQAEAAAADAKRCLDELARGTEKGTPWCSGSLGRALLAWHCSKLEEKHTTAVELLREAKKTISTSRDPQGFALYVLADLLTKIDTFLRDYDAKEQPNA